MTKRSAPKTTASKREARGRPRVVVARPRDFPIVEHVLALLDVPDELRDCPHYFFRSAHASSAQLLASTAEPPMPAALERSAADLLALGGRLLELLCEDAPRFFGPDDGAGSYTHGFHRGASFIRACEALEEGGFEILLYTDIAAELSRPGPAEVSVDRIRSALGAAPSPAGRSVLEYILRRGAFPEIAPYSIPLVPDRLEGALSGAVERWNDVDERLLEALIRIGRIRLGALPIGRPVPTLSDGTPELGLSRHALLRDRLSRHGVTPVEILAALVDGRFGDQRWASNGWALAAELPRLTTRTAQIDADDLGAASIDTRLRRERAYRALLEEPLRHCNTPPVRRLVSAFLGDVSASRSVPAEVLPTLVWLSRDPSLAIASIACFEAIGREATAADHLGLARAVHGAEPARHQAFLERAAARYVSDPELFETFLDAIELLPPARRADGVWTGFLALVRSYRELDPAHLARLEALVPRSHDIPAAIRAALAKELSDPRSVRMRRSLQAWLKRRGVLLDKTKVIAIEALDVTLTESTGVAALALGSPAALAAVEVAEELDDLPKLARKHGAAVFRTAGDGTFRVRLVGRQPARRAGARTFTFGVEIQGETIALSGIANGRPGPQVLIPDGRYQVVITISKSKRADYVAWLAPIQKLPRWAHGGEVPLIE